MAGWRQAVEVAMTDEDVARLMAISRSRTEPASRVERAQMLLAYREKPLFFAVGQRLGVHHQMVQRCIGAYISRETQVWLATQPAGRFAFTFTPKHGSWLNLIEGFFSKFARSVLRHIRVTSKQELKERIMLGIKDVNRYPVIHTWSYKLAEAA
jgi:hypothetical protein